MERMTTTGTRRPAGEARMVADIIAELAVAVRELRCIGSQRLAHGGLSLGSFHLTSILERHGPMSMSRIAELVDVSFPTATGIVDRLEERGLVERVRVPDDRRLVLVQLTEGGRQALRDVDVLKEAFLEKVLTGLEPSNLAALSAVLRDVRRVVGELAESEPDLFAHHHDPRQRRN
jgi:DNA-binding MarR family transcriptional regulator